ncbi:MAG: phage Bobb, partial [Bacteroidota bacterium]
MIFFTSDTHFFHEKMIDYEKTSRSFSSVEEMDEILISNWNSKITDNDIVYHLGDFSFGNEKETCSV